MSEKNAIIVAPNITIFKYFSRSKFRTLLLNIGKQPWSEAMVGSRNWDVIYVRYPSVHCQLILIQCTQLRLTHINRSKQSMHLGSNDVIFPGCLSYIHLFSFQCITENDEINCEFNLWIFR